MRTSLAIPLLGALGLLAVLRTARFYYGVDGLALTITLVMGSALLLGVALTFANQRTRATQ